MRGAVAAVAVAALILLSGCGLTPFGAETLPPVQATAARITEGFGTEAEYGQAVSVGPGNVVQFRAKIADGKAMIVTIPRGPATRVVATFRAEGAAAASGSSVLSSRDGKPFSLGDAFQFDPGYLAIERHSTAAQIELRVAVPRLIDEGQGQARFTFKVRVR